MTNFLDVISLSRYVDKKGGESAGGNQGFMAGKDPEPACLGGGTPRNKTSGDRGGDDNQTASV